MPFSREDRSREIYHHIDPGFINPRLCYSTFGRPLVETFEAQRRPENEHWDRLHNHHLLVDIALAACNALKVAPLGEVLADPQVGAIFSSSETLEGTPDVYTEGRVRNRVLLAFEYEREVYLEFGTEHFVASTGRSEQTQRGVVSIIGVVREFSDDHVRLAPIIMGAPSLDHPLNSASGLDAALLMWEGSTWYEIYPGDIDEFERINGASESDEEEWTAYMRELPETDVKQRFAEILSAGPANADWGGDLYDLAADVRLSGHSKRAAFLLKGPGSGFSEMTPRMLGRNADQIFRLSKAAADILIVQHCHRIGDAVRETLRNFAVVPHHPRRYCVIDGQATYKLFRAYSVV
jgi:hypothetical protein